MNSKLMRYFCAIALLALLTACSGKKKVEDAAIDNKDQVGTDITRPPELVKGKRVEPVESDPDETISFDKWRKQQEVDE